ncbi:M-phase phosphoprotein 6-like [Amphiura filiformis]|uniref:M-phase phosphoprotein 6-like n=1 Tax=Amphiura filiformis TaxID=82378 RepID=UPI003B220662
MAAGSSQNAKPKLSKHLKQMKFMQRTQEKEEEDELEKERQQRIDEAHWALDLPELQVKESKYEIEPSFVICEDLHQFGRMSFKGINPTIERIMKNIEAEKSEKACEEREKDLMVTDEEMADRYNTLVGTIGKKFVKKRDRMESDIDTAEPVMKKHRKQFMKPSDDDI